MQQSDRRLTFQNTNIQDQRTWKDECGVAGGTGNFYVVRMHHAVNSTHILRRKSILVLVNVTASVVVVVNVTAEKKKKKKEKKKKNLKR